MRKLLLILVIGGGVGWYVWKNEPETKNKLMDRVDDALNRRPNEELKDAMEDARDAAGDVVREVKETFEEAVSTDKKK